MAAIVSPLIIGGISRLPLAEEKALNLLLLKAGGSEHGAQLYKLGWALEDNHATYDETSGQYKYDAVKIPICFHPCQASYHLLVWEPPSVALEEYASQLIGEDTSKGSYNCILHFIDGENGQPFKPTASIMELVIPAMKSFNEIAFAARRGFQSTVARMRKQKIAAVEDQEKKKQKDYDGYALALLEDSAPAFEGNPTTFPNIAATGGWRSKELFKSASFSDLLPGERDKPSAVIAPERFVFTARVPRKPSSS
jgi:hypothetical protein